MTNRALAEIADTVSEASHVCIVGSGAVSRPPHGTGVLELRAPSGIVAHVPDELLVTVLAGTPVVELAHVLEQAGQRLRLPNLGTVGGAVATRRNGVFPLSNATLPNTVLMTRSVSGRGEVFVTGGPTVKNVSGFDLTKALTGSWGIFAVLVEISLRVEPVPPCSRWFTGRGPDAIDSCRQLFRPTVAMADADTVTVCLEGHPNDVAEQAALLRDCTEIDEPSAVDHLSSIGACSTRPSLVGEDPQAMVVRRLKESFDPAGKLNSHLTMIPHDGDLG